MMIILKKLKKNIKKKAANYGIMILITQYFPNYLINNPLNKCKYNNNNYYPIYNKIYLI